MKRVINCAGCLLVLAGCSFVAWSVYFLLTATSVTLWASGPFGLSSVPRILITSPETAVVSQPRIQVTGCFPVEIKTVSCDVTGAAGADMNRTLAGVVTAGVYDPAKPASTTHCFEVNDIVLAPGKNHVTVHIRDVSGKQYSLRQCYILASAAGSMPSADTAAPR